MALESFTPSRLRDHTLACGSVFVSPKPQGAGTRCRNLSRSSGVIFSQRSAQRSSMRSCMRRRMPMPIPRCPPPLNPPNKIRHNTSIASACQKVIVRHPNSVGSSQFHRHCTIQPPSAIRSAIPTMAKGAPIEMSLFLVIFSSSRFPKFVVYALQALAQMEHRIPFAPQQRVHAHARLNRHLFEAEPLDLVPYEDLSLLLR